MLVIEKRQYIDKIGEINNIIKENKQLEIISTKDKSVGHNIFGALYKNRIVLFCTLRNL